MLGCELKTHVLTPLKSVHNSYRDWANARSIIGSAALSGGHFITRAAAANPRTAKKGIALEKLCVTSNTLPATSGPIASPSVKAIDRIPFRLPYRRRPSDSA